MPIVLGALVLLSLATPLAARASCIAPPALAAVIASSPTVFVGTVTDVQNGARVATVHVDDVWKGAGLKTVVVVVGTPDLGAVVTSVDRTFAVGQQYLFVPNSGRGDRFQDNACTLTQRYSVSLASLRPQGASRLPRDIDGSRRPALLIVVGGVAMLLAAGGVAFELKRRRARLQRTEP